MIIIRIDVEGGVRVVSQWSTSGIVPMGITPFVRWLVNDNLDPAVDSLICIGGGARQIELWSVYARAKYFADIREVPPKDPATGCAPRCADVAANTSTSTSAPMSVPRSKVMLLLLAARVVLMAHAMHSVQMRTVRPTSRRVWHGSDERRTRTNRIRASIREQG